ncbi:MAG TPA: glycosyltransferase [Vicinamibacterales bacterium]|nr:glycosyltransferase [Vicinamibacterales bacterium]
MRESLAVDISVVIPAFNEAQYLPRLMETLDVARTRYGRGAERVEVVVADNGSTDETVDVASASGCTVVHVSPRVIGAVRNGGAHAASGDILVFVDADARVHPETFNAIAEYFAVPTRVLGVSGVAPERRSTGLDVTWMILGALTALLGFGIPTSRATCVAAGVVSCRRDDWRKVGGYSERLMFAEDAHFLLALKGLGRQRGQTIGWLKDVPAVFSTRKFDEHGDWHYVRMPVRFLFAILWPDSMRRWAQR